MNPASEEHRYPEVPLEVMNRFFLAKQVDVEEMVAKINVQGHGIGQQEAVAGTEIDGEAVIACKARRAEPGNDVEIGVIGARLADKYLARQNIVTEVQIIVSVLPVTVRQ